MPDPRNPRVNPARRHPAAGILGNEESTRFRPLPDPVPAPGGRPEMVVTVKNQEHLAWASHQAKTFVLSANDWRESIRNQGVMTEVWLAGVTFDHLGGLLSAFRSRSRGRAASPLYMTFSTSAQRMSPTRVTTASFGPTSSG